MNVNCNCDKCNDMKKQIRQLEELEQALYKFKTSAIGLEIAWSEDESDFLNENENVSGYPFNKSFDEMTSDVMAWVDDVTLKIELKKMEIAERG